MIVMSKDTDFQELIGSVFASSDKLAKGSSLQNMIKQKRDAEKKKTVSSDIEKKDVLDQQNSEQSNDVDFPEQVQVDSKISETTVVSIPESNVIKEEMDVVQSEESDKKSAIQDVSNSTENDVVKDLALNRFERYFEVNEIEFSKVLNISSHILNDISIIVRISNKCSIQVFFDNFVKDWLFSNQEFIAKLGLSEFVAISDSYKIFPKKAHCEYDLSDLKKRCYEWRGKVNTGVRVSVDLFEKLRALCTFTKIPVVYYLQLAYDEFLIKNRKVLEKQKYYSLLSFNQKASL